jgi:hypothetical protein
VGEAARSPRQLKLLLDTMHAPVVAAALRREGHDVEAAADDRAARNFTDDELMEHAVSVQRAIVTEDVADFRQIAATWAATGRTHTGILYTPASRFARASSRYPRDLIQALATFLRAPPPATTSSSWEWWLT